MSQLDLTRHKFVVGEFAPESLPGESLKFIQHLLSNVDLKYVLYNALINNAHSIHVWYIFTYIYHKDQPFMWVYVPVPWILWVMAVVSKIVAPSAITSRLLGVGDPIYRTAISSESNLSSFFGGSEP